MKYQWHSNEWNGSQINPLKGRGTRQMLRCLSFWLIECSLSASCSKRNSRVEIIVCDWMRISYFNDKSRVINESQSTPLSCAPSICHTQQSTADANPTSYQTLNINSAWGSADVIAYHSGCPTFHSKNPRLSLLSRHHSYDTPPISLSQLCWYRWKCNFALFLFVLMSSLFIVLWLEWSVAMNCVLTMSMLCPLSLQHDQTKYSISNLQSSFIMCFRSLSITRTQCLRVMNDLTATKQQCPLPHTQIHFKCFIQWHSSATISTEVAHVGDGFDVDAVV